VTAAQFQKRRANRWRYAFFILLLLAFCACFYFYAKGHDAGQEFIEKKAGAQMYFSNLSIAGAGDFHEMRSH
jgi:lipopolysaccharide export system protein LptC